MLPQLFVELHNEKGYTNVTVLKPVRFNKQLGKYCVRHFNKWFVVIKAKRGSQVYYYIRVDQAIDNPFP